MSDAHLRERHVAVLLGHVVEFLRSAPLAAPDRHEREPAYTGRCLQGPVASLLAGLDIKGLVRSGDGAASVRTVNLLGLPFYPDLAISFHAEPLIAVEVKYLRSGGRQNPIATALGQTMLYQNLGYRRACTFFVDITNQVGVTEILHAENTLNKVGIASVVRRKLGTRLLPHPSAGGV